jgi:hypothetical protein
MIDKLIGGLVPGWVWIVAGAAAITGFGAWCNHLGYARAERSFGLERLAWQTERATAATTTAAWQVKARAADAKAHNTERLWLGVARSIDHDGNKTADRLRTVVARGDAVHAGLSGELAATVAGAARAASDSQGAADAQCRAAAAETTRVHAELLGECYATGRARNLYADQAAAAGTACERWADALGQGQATQ